MRRLLILTLLISVGIVSGCGQSEAERTAEEQQAIRAALQYDSEITEQNASGASLGEMFFGASDERKANYVRNLRRVPLDNTPDNFRQAYLKHIEAWESRNNARIEATWMDVLAIARLHGVSP